MSWLTRRTGYQATIPNAVPSQRPAPVGLTGEITGDLVSAAAKEIEATLVNDPQGDWFTPGANVVRVQLLDSRGVVVGAADLQHVQSTVVGGTLDLDIQIQFRT